MLRSRRRAGADTIRPPNVVLGWGVRGHMEQRRSRAALAAGMALVASLGPLVPSARAADGPARIATLAGNGTPGNGGDGGDPAAARLDAPPAVAIAPGGAGVTAYVTSGDRVRRVHVPPPGSDEPATVTTHTSGLAHPGGLAVDRAGNVFVADTNRSQVRKVTPDGSVSVVAGTGEAGYSGDGGAAGGAQLQFALDVAADGEGNLYIADTGNNRLRKVDAAGAITTVAGNGAPEVTGDGGQATAAGLGIPRGVAVDTAGNVFVAVVAGDDGRSRVRRVTPFGVITTVAGGGTAGLGDGGPATDAELSFALNGPAGVAASTTGDLLVADAGHHRVRRVDAAGTITTLAGTGEPGFSGDGGPATLAQLDSPSGLGVDAGGQVLVADTGNHRLRAVSGGSAGELTVRIEDAGTSEGHAGETPLRFAVRLSRPAAEAVSVDFSTLDGSATAGTDYLAASGRVSIAAGQLSSEVTIAVVGDEIPEAPESFSVLLSNPTGAVLVDATSEGSILDDDGEIAALSVGDVRVVEDDSKATQAMFTLTQSRSVPFPVSVRYATADGDAQAPGDYLASSGALTLEAGRTSITFSVQVNGDTLDELDEGFLVVLSAPQGGVIADADATGTIADDDGLWRTTPPLAAAHVGADAVAIDGPGCGGVAPSPEPTCGDVLLIGGDTAAVERYDHGSGMWSSAAPLPKPLADHASVLLSGAGCAAASEPGLCGQVLVTGGTSRGGSPLREARRYDPGTDTWASVAAMATPRAGHTATLLTDGSVLVVGGGPRGAERYVPEEEAWRPAGRLFTGRVGHSATLLDGPTCRAAVPAPYCGKVLVAGGGTAGTELYDPAQGTWSAMASLGEARTGHTATLLLGPACTSLPAPDYCGKVLVAGGGSVTAELYDPAAGPAGRWDTASSMSRPRAGHVAVPLVGPSCGAAAGPCGSVLVAGGTAGEAGEAGEEPSATAELYDPGTGTWAVTESMTAPRGGSAAVALTDGRVLVAGGRGLPAGSPDPDPAAATAERYDPAASPGGPLVSGLEPSAGPTFGGTEVTIHGRGLLGTRAVRFGGEAAASVRVRSDTEIVAVSPAQPTQGPVDVSLGTPTGSAAGSILRFTYGPGAWVATGSMATARVGAVAVLLDPATCRAPSPSFCGKVLVAGGERGGTGRAELYDPAGTGSFEPTGSMTVERAVDPTIFASFTATLIDGPPSVCGQNCGKVLVAGGFSGLDVDEAMPHALASAELYDPSTGTWAPTGDMAHARVGHTATLLGDGTVLVAGGTDGPTALAPPVQAGAEVFDPKDGSWHQVGDMATGRQLHTATLLPTGEVLVAAGAGEPTALGLQPLRSAELYDPVARRWHPAASLAVGRFSHSATLLTEPGCGSHCGKVLVAGGAGVVAGDLASSELYDPGPGQPGGDRWAPAGLMHTGRANHAAVALPGGAVLVAGGFHAGVGSGSAEVFDPATGEWGQTAAMAATRAAPAATLLDGPACRAAPPAAACGRVMLAGGHDPDSRGFNLRASAERYTAAPQVTAAQTALGPSRGGTPVVLSGAGFATAREVRFGTAPAASFSPRSGGELVAVTPAHPSRAVPVTVVNDGGTSATPGSDSRRPFRFVVSEVPAGVSDLHAEATSASGVRLTWSAPASDGLFPPPAGRYVVRQSNPDGGAVGEEATFAAARDLCMGGVCEFSPAAVGAKLSLTITDLRPGTTYHYALRAVNDIGGGPLSNDTWAATLGTAPMPTVSPRVASFGGSRDAPAGSPRRIGRTRPPPPTPVAAASPAAAPAVAATSSAATPAGVAPPSSKIRRAVPPLDGGGSSRWLVTVAVLSAGLGAVAGGFWLHRRRGFYR